MADTSKPDGLPEGAKYTPPKPKPVQNPVFRMMGMPNIRFRLPSRNWMVFLSVTGSFAAAVTYDRQQKKAVQRKWCDLVAHIAQEPLPIRQMPRRLTIFLSAAPGDGIRPSRDYFREYIKPILVAAAMDYDVIEGRKEGEVRYGTAEQIRRQRRKMGEKGNVDQVEEMDVEQAIDMTREKMQVEHAPGFRGDLVIGRHTWKEYIRGLHEGWLGPLDEPPVPVPEPSPVHVEVPETTIPSSDSETPSGNETTTPEPEKKPEEEEKEKKPPFPPPAYISTSAYSSSQLSPYIPQVLEPSAPLHQRHLLGFLKTPQRIWDFLNRRHLADQLGRETAAIVLAAHQPYQQDSAFASTSTASMDDSTPVATRTPENDATADVVQTRQAWEQQAELFSEEYYWHKSVRKPRKTDDQVSQAERVWKDDVVMDPRIAERMSKFALSPEEEQRAERIGQGLEKGLAKEVVDLRAEKIQMPATGDLDTE